MLTMDLKRVVTIISCTVILYVSFLTMKDFLRLSEAQAVNNQNVVSIRETWLALSPSIKKWNNEYISDSSIKDLNGVYSAINLERHGLKPSSLNLVASNRTEVKFEEQPLGLSKTCITNVAGGFQLQSNHVSSYVQGLKSLYQRNDIEFGRLTLTGGKVGDSVLPTVMFDKLCIILRGEDTFKDSGASGELL